MLHAYHVRHASLAKDQYYASRYGSEPLSLNRYIVGRVALLAAEASRDP
jgi:hypothetical protein